MKVGPKSSLRPFLHRALQLIIVNIYLSLSTTLYFTGNFVDCTGKALNVYNSWNYMYIQ